MNGVNEEAGENITFYKSFGNGNAVVFTKTDLINPKGYAASKNCAQMIDMQMKDN